MDAWGFLHFIIMLKQNMAYVTHCFFFTSSFWAIARQDHWYHIDIDFQSQYQDSLYNKMVETPIAPRYNELPH